MHGHTHTHKINSKIKYFSTEYKIFKLKTWYLSFLFYSGSCSVAQVGYEPAVFLLSSCMPQAPEFWSYTMPDLTVFLTKTFNYNVAESVGVSWGWYYIKPEGL